MFQDIQALKQTYIDLYPILETETNTKAQFFPDITKEIFTKDNIQKLYKKTEKTFGFTDITTQNNKKFIETIYERIKGLEYCIKDETENKKCDKIKRIKYYQEEHENEYKKYEEVHQDAKLSSSSPAQQLEKLCTNIKWGNDIYNYNNAKIFINNFEEEYDNFYNFITKTNGEEAFVKTFLPDKCFELNGNGKLIETDKLKSILHDIALNPEESDIYKQYIFGIGDDIRKFARYRNFYNTYIIMSLRSIKDKDNDNDNDKTIPKLEKIRHNCHPLVNWTIFLNMLYSRCATYNTKIPFPIRFILPENFIPYIIDPDESYKNINIYDA